VPSGSVAYIRSESVRLVFKIRPPVAFGTVIDAEPEATPDVALMVAEPSAKGETRPAFVTDATADEDEDQATDCEMLPEVPSS